MNLRRKFLLLTLLLTICSAQAFSFDHPGGMHPKSQIDFVKSQIKSGQSRYVEGLNQLMGLADSALRQNHNAVEDYSVPGAYVNITMHRKNSTSLQSDSFNAYACALAWQLTGNKRYADKALYFLNAWAAINKKVSDFDGPLVMSYSGTAMIMAAELMYNYKRWRPSDKALFDLWAANVYRKCTNQIRTRKNNWADWGRFGSSLAAWYLNDKAEMEENLRLVKSDMFLKLAPDGSMPEEVKREANGIWYTYFSLAPMTASLWVLYQATGENLFVAQQDGCSIKKSLDYLLYHNQNPKEWRWNDKPVVGRPNNPFPANAKGFWPANLMEAMYGIYSDKKFEEYAAPHRPLSYVRHHFAWSFPSLMPCSLTGYEVK